MYFCVHARESAGASMGLANKLLLASKKAGTLGNWQGDVSLTLIYAGVDGYVYDYTRAYQDEGEGSLFPLLQIVKSDTQIYNVTLVVDTITFMLTGAALYFYNLPEPAPPTAKRFAGLSSLIIHSTTGGEPFTISDVQSCWDNTNMCYDLFSEDLANWGYTNLSAAGELEFTLELEWYE